MIQFAKSITSGSLPLGGVGMSDEIADTINNSSKPWMHAYTYSGHPTTCAVGLATLDIIEGEDLPGQAATKGVRMLENLHETLDSHPHVGNVRGLGLMMGVEVVKDKADKSWFEPEFNLGGKLTKAMMDRKLTTRVRSEVICIAPPLTSDESVLDEIVEIVNDAICEVLGR